MSTTSINHTWNEILDVLEIPIDGVTPRVHSIVSELVRHCAESYRNMAEEMESFVFGGDIQFVQNCSDTIHDVVRDHVQRFAHNFSIAKLVAHELSPVVRIWTSRRNPCPNVLARVWASLQEQVVRWAR